MRTVTENRRLTAWFASLVLLASTAAADNAFRVVVSDESPSPAANAQNVDVRTVVRVYFTQPIDPATLTARSMRLLDDDDHVAPAYLQTDLTGGVATLTPTHALKTDTRYTLQIRPPLTSAKGKAIKPFESSFTTSKNMPKPDPRFVGRAKKLADRDHNTCLTLGPDGCLYVADAFGEIKRFKLDDDTGLARDSDAPYRAKDDQIVDMVFDPDATADRLVMWISYGRYDGQYNGAIARIELPAFGSKGKAKKRDVIVGLPHDVLLHHQPNGIAFGPDGKLYQSMGGVATLGGTPNWGMAETPLSAAVIVADVRSPKFNGGELPCDVKTAPPVNYDPTKPDAPVRVFATGFRNAYGLWWHSTGHLYTATNQNSIGNGPKTPANKERGVPAINAMPHEMLYRVVAGQYYGHPNPARGEYVLNGGNPTAGVDPFEVPEYPVGVKPEPHFDPSLIYDLRPGGGNSANGMCEYTAPGPLRGRLLIAYFSGSKGVQTFALDKRGRVTHEHPLINKDGDVIRFKGAIDVATHAKTGRIYVADFGEWKRPNFGLGGAVWMVEMGE